jgi:hypothetical protein
LAGVVVSDLVAAVSDFEGALSDFDGTVVLGGLLLEVAPLDLGLSLDFEAVPPDLLACAFAMQPSFSAAGTFAHALVASSSRFAGTRSAAVAGLSAAGAAAG